MLNKYHTLYLEVTRNCNLGCQFCSTGSHPEKKYDDISFQDIVDKIMVPAYSLGTKLINFSGGEFLLREDAIALIIKANEIGFGIGIASNGLLLTDKKLEEIKDAAGDNLIISLGINSFDTDNVKTRNVEAEFTLNVLEKIEKHHIRANISVTIGEFNKELFETTVLNIKKHSLPFNRIPFVPRSCPKHELMFNKDSLRDFFHPVLRKYFNGQVSYTPYMLPPEVYERISGQDLKKEQIPINPSAGCWVGSYYAINAEGEVSPCPMFLDHVSGGNVLKTPLKEILFESELFRKITDRSHLEGKCGNCKYTHTCGGCRVMSYYYKGNVYAEDPTCFLHELNDEQVKEIENDIIKSFKNYVRMAQFGKIYTIPKS